MNALLSHPLVTALAVTLLHSLWIFAVLTGLGWWLAAEMKTARHRYLAYLVTLLSFPIAFLTVLFLKWRAQNVAWSAATFLSEQLGTGPVLELTGNLTKLGIEAPPRWLSYLAMAYLTGLVVGAGLNVYRYGVTVRMRRGGWPAPAAFRDAFERLKGQLVSGRRVTWSISKRVTEALTVGVLRPVILFPVGLINALSPEEVEAILRHELTHIRHNDPLWNAVQQLIVSTFFYHPLVYLLSHRLDREREYACDDVVAATTAPDVYAGALVRAARFSVNSVNTFTMAAANKNYFSARIQRLFSTSASASPKGGTRRYSLLAPLAILPFCLLFAFAPNAAERQDWAIKTAPGTTVGKVIIRGVVTDCTTGDPLIGATVMVEGSDIGTITGFKGDYELTVDPGPQPLVFAYDGYETVSTNLDVARDQYADVAMCKGEAGKTSVRIADKAFSVEADDAAASDSVSENESPGKEILYIVDGKRHDSDIMKNIETDDIEKIEVFKDAAKMEAFGYGTDFRGAIIITMKK